MLYFSTMACGEQPRVLLRIGGSAMHSQKYLEARKEFINCIIMSPVGLFVPLFIAFREWYPIMQEERAKETAGAE